MTRLASSAVELLRMFGLEKLNGLRDNTYEDQ